MLVHEIARASGLSRDGVRHYEALGLIASSPIQAGSRVYRDYQPSVLETIERVRQAQRLGFSLKEIVPLLRSYGDATLSAEETVAFLQERLVTIRRKRAELAEIDRFIRRKIEHYQKLVPGTAPS
jgi:DNA-binding transcriptional MerR regulator